LWSIPVAQRIDEQGEGGGGLAAAGVIETVARPGGALVLERLGELAFGDVRRDDILGDIGEAEADERGFERLKCRSFILICALGLATP
jgi:hypothetical protein